MEIRNLAKTIVSGCAAFVTGEVVNGLCDDYAWKGFGPVNLVGKAALMLESMALSYVAAGFTFDCLLPEKKDEVKEIEEEDGDGRG